MQVFAEIKPNYEKLNEILLDHVSDIRFEKNVYVIVDMKEIFRKIFRPNFFDPNNVSPLFVEEAASDIIGIISHYRNYFFKNGKTSTFFFLYSNTQCQKMISLYPDYKKDMYAKYYMDPVISVLKNRILDSVSAISAISNCFLIDTSITDDVVALKFLLNSINAKTPVILLSNDALWFQMIDGQKPIFAMNCKGLNSQIVNVDNMMTIVTETEQPGYSSKLLPLYLSLNDDKKYSLYRLNGIGAKRANITIRQLLQDNIIIDCDYIRFPLTQENIAHSAVMPTIKQHLSELTTNYDIITGNKILYSTTNELFAMFNIPVKWCPYDFFLDLNAKVFTHFPLSIDLLFKGE